MPVEINSPKGVLSFTVCMLELACTAVSDHIGRNEGYGSKYQLIVSERVY